MCRDNGYILLEFGDFGIILPGVEKIAFGVFHGGTIGVGLRVVPFELDRFVEVADSPFQIAFGVFRETAIIVGFRIIRPEFDGFAEIRDSSR